MEPLPDLAAMDKKALESLLVELYDRSCKAFGAAFDIQQEVKVMETFVMSVCLHPDVCRSMIY